MAIRVMEKVKPGRFLVKMPDGYVESDDERAREKTCQALREGAAKLRKSGYGVPYQALKPAPKIKLPNERVCGDKYSQSEYSADFEPPRKKVKTL